jgi:LDH2 family malate/lactate/ureidoglycolate dehydrogenase
MKLTTEELASLAIELLVKNNVPESAARTCAAVLVDAELEGLSSHGIMRLPIYLAAIKRGQLDPFGQVLITQTGAATAAADGGNTLGQVVSVAAMDAAIELARDAGIGMVTARNSNHNGAASYYVQMATEQGLIGISATNSPPGIAPWGGKEPYLGTNPIAFGFPTKGDPVIIDLSLSVVARGKVIQAAKAGKPIPAGWALDKDGNPTDAQAALGGAMLPLGGAKGFALALAVEILAAVVGGAAFGSHVVSILEENTEPANVGHWFMVIDPARFGVPEVFLDNLETLLSELKTIPLAQGHAEIRIPGAQRAATRRRLLSDGIQIPDELYNSLHVG